MTQQLKDEADECGWKRAAFFMCPFYFDQKHPVQLETLPVESSTERSETTLKMACTTTR